tara:strand:+ start:775 stop:1158 length:384 start_codon:yes stop_codon:yes gene_type:complete
MKNFKEMVYGNLFEAKGFKPDFLDLDKDGNKTEPMKQAAKDAKLEEEAHEEAKPSLEEEVKTILDEEGGAADLNKIEEKLLAKNVEVPMDLEKKLEGMENVMRHPKGDYIEMSGLKEENPNMMLPIE